MMGEHRSSATLFNRSGWQNQPEGVLRFSFAKSLNRSEQGHIVARFTEGTNLRPAEIINRSEPSPAQYPDRVRRSRSRRHQSRHRRLLL